MTQRFVALGIDQETPDPPAFLLEGAA